ncbi:PD-(D/E)XK motif protein [Anaerorudis cellulosivorans]|uniref:PD-(D/E)XK motif protein n=1 Tax=Anaerorudis cellulosivorans TaxID=3397862 RepID=UPI002220E7BC|nr:PD-(D/E)XK motif protein [Seramator thermalis]MCW1735110.1 PD-(D/E)XK motif protein [Seramator thermalis]
MMNNILDIWSNIEQTNETGLLKRLYTSETELHIYGIFQNPEKYCGIALSFSKDIYVDILSFSNLRDLQVSLQPDTSFFKNNMLIIKLLQYENRDVFAVMCENMVQSVITLHSEKQVVQTILNQLEKWQSLFEKMKGDGLTFYEQQGLYGELHFLQKLIAKQNIILALNSWVGTEKGIRDFQYNDWAVEVKTTSGNNHQKVNINNERQLDETMLKNLFLFHLSVEVAKKNGENLNFKINLIRESLKNDIMFLNIFNKKLLEAGYFEKHAYLYDERCYQIRNENYYRIDGEFPRIKEKEIRNGVGDVRYSIILSHCNDYLVDEMSVLNTIESI